MSDLRYASLPLSVSAAATNSDAGVSHQRHRRRQAKLMVDEAEANITSYVLGPVHNEHGAATAAIFSQNKAPRALCSLAT